MKRFQALIIVPALLSGAGAARANTVELVGVSQSDGSYYVMPYELSIDGGSAVDAICYDFLDQISLNESWTANEVTLSSLSQDAAYNEYEEVAWLGLQWFSDQTMPLQDAIDLQYMIWGVFDANAPAFNNDAFTQSILANEASGIEGLDTADFTFLEAVPNGANGTGNDTSTAQSFLLYASIGDAGQGPETPEPASVVLVAIGVGLIAVSRLRQGKTADARRTTPGRNPQVFLMTN